MWKLDRLGRSLRDLYNDARRSPRPWREIPFAYRGNRHDHAHRPRHVADDWRSSILAELERSLISERTRAGVKAAQRRGVKFGRKPRITPEQIDHARKLIDKGEARQYVADLLNVGRSTLYRALVS